jgi:hypothetical protein
VASNNFGAVTSTVATLIVDLKPVILNQPSNTVVSPGVSTSLFVNAVGPSLNFSWFHNDTPIGPNDPTLPIVGNPGVEGPYRVVITNFAGSVTSTVANVSWSPTALTILSQPQSQTVGIGSPVGLSVVASGVAPINYQWFKDNAPLLGETTSVLSFASAARSNSATYRVVVSNPFLSINSSNAVLAVVAPPLVSIAGINETTVAVTVFGDPGKLHRLLTSTNLESAPSTWSQVATHTLPGSGTASWNVTKSTNAGPTFFRVVTP